MWWVCTGHDSDNRSSHSVAKRWHSVQVRLPVIAELCLVAETDHKPCVDKWARLCATLCVGIGIWISDDFYNWKTKTSSAFGCRETGVRLWFADLWWRCAPWGSRAPCPLLEQVLCVWVCVGVLLSNLSTQRGTWTCDPEVKRPIFYLLSQPGAPHTLCLSYWFLSTLFLC